MIERDQLLWRVRQTMTRLRKLPLSTQAALLPMVEDVLTMAEAGATPEEIHHAFGLIPDDPDALCAYAAEIVTRAAELNTRESDDEA